MNFFGLYITTKDYEATANSSIQEMRRLKANLRESNAGNAALRASVRKLTSDINSLKRNLDETLKEKDCIACRLDACESKLSNELSRDRKGSRKLKKKFQKAILKCKSEILELKASCNELASDNILISRKLEHQENCTTELAWYKAAISRCKQRCRNVSNSPEFILKSLLSEVDKYRKR